MRMKREQAQLLRAWNMLGIGPAWMVRGPGDNGSSAGGGETDQEPATGPATTTVESPPIDSPTPVAPGHTMTEQPVSEMNWVQLRDAVRDCRACGLCESRQQTVFGVGDDAPRWLIVGEAPGAQEDRLGEPFVGEAGQLLDAMLASIGVSRRKGVFILNVLKCRPPGNRDPEPDEVASCSAYLHRQVELLGPDLIFSMGRFATQSMLGSEQSIGALRQQVHQVTVGDRQIPLVVGYHPAYLLRRPEEKLKAWHDICLARTVCDPAVQRPTTPD